MKTSSAVENSEQLVNAMGYWPSFHDAKVESVEHHGHSIQISVHVFAMTSEVDSAGYYVLDKHHLAELDFQGVVSAALPPNYQSDCLDRMWFELTEDGVRGHIESHMGLGGSILCSRVVLQSVLPCSPDGSVTRGVC